MSEEIKVRHFILCNDTVREEQNTFTAKGIFEYFSAENYPSECNYKLMIGIYFLQPNNTYSMEVRVYQRNKLIGHWSPVTLTVDKPNEIMNVRLLGDNMIIPEPVPLDFEILINGNVINRQTVLAIKEVAVK